MPGAGEQVRRTSPAILPRIARFILRLGGWTIAGEAPSVPRAVLIAAPHTSNWDGVWSLVYKVAVRLDTRFFAKESLFWFPLSLLLRGLGGIPLDRQQANSAVSRAVAMFAGRDRFYFCLAPEGTRKKTTHWKTGFYRIAHDAGVPVVAGFLDYRTRRIGLGPTVNLTGDMNADLDVFRRFYASIEGRRPEQASPIVFQSNDKA